MPFIKTVISLVLLCSLVLSFAGGAVPAYAISSSDVIQNEENVIEVDTEDEALIPSSPDRSDTFSGEFEAPAVTELLEEDPDYDNMEQEPLEELVTSVIYSPVEDFVRRLYRYVVLRDDPSDAEVANWVNNLLTGGGTGASVANAFFISSTFINQRVTDIDYVTRLYKAVVGRYDPSYDEVDNWVRRLASGMPREEVFAAFINSASFTDMCNDAGIIRGTYTPPPGGRIRVFVTRLYRDVVGRHDPSPGEVNNWVNNLMTGGGTGASVANAFFTSSTFLNQRTSDVEYVITLYTALIGRDPFDWEVHNWADQLASGLPREEVFAAFINSHSFSAICREAGINRGTFTPPPGGRVRTFVIRLYREVLGRHDPSTNEVSHWTNILLGGGTGASVANSFFTSSTFINMRVSDEEYVTRLYRAMIGREPLDGEVEHWVEQLEMGLQRGDVFAAFVNSNAFTSMCRDYGITRGNFSGSLLGKVIILDPGHGTIGSPGTAGYNEAVAMLDLARRIRPLLEAQGATVIMTRDSEVNVPIAVRCAMINIRALEAVRGTRTNASEIAEINRLIGVMQSIMNNPSLGNTYMNVDPFNASRHIHPDLRQIFELQNNPVIRDNFLMISLHSNAATSTGVRGAEVYFIDPSAHSNTGTYFGGFSYTAQSRAFANILLNHIHNAGIPRRTHGLRAENYAMIREINIPAVLTENGFHTNAEDRELLSSPDFRQHLAVAYQNAIIEYFRQIVG
jgi:N-acetylmuramoyl-L-alanine amidase